MLPDDLLLDPEFDFAAGALRLLPDDGVRVVVVERVVVRERDTWPDRELPERDDLLTLGAVLVLRSFLWIVDELRLDPEERDGALSRVVVLREDRLMLGLLLLLLDS